MHQLESSFEKPFEDWLGKWQGNFLDLYQSVKTLTNVASGFSLNPAAASLALWRPFYSGSLLNTRAQMLAGVLYPRGIGLPMENTRVHPHT